MTTFAEMKTNVARDLRDPGKLTFQDDTLGDLINAGISEISRIAPVKFQEFVSLVSTQLNYYVQTTLAYIPTTTPFSAHSTNTIYAEAHNLTANTPIRFYNLTGGAGLVEGITYYVIASGLTADAFKVSSVVGGVAVNFTTDIEDGTLFYRSAANPPNTEIEINRVELWNIFEFPERPMGVIPPAAGEYVNYSEVGWSFWSGTLQIPDRYVRAYGPTDTTGYALRVWGYAPYLQMASESDDIGMSAELQWALRAYCRVEALQRLVFERDLFSQWQIRSNNTDVSPAALMNSLSLAQADWNRRSRQIAVLREAP